MREYFTENLYKLTDEAAPRTLLLTGLLPPSLARREALPEADELTELLISRWRRLNGRPWAWRLREGTARLLSGPDEIERLVKSGDGLLTVAGDDWAAHGPGLRLEVNATGLLDAGFLYMTLLRGGAHSAFLRREKEGELAWAWPLRIGVTAASRLLAGVSPDSPLRPLFREFNFERAPARANLLLFEASLSEVAGMYERGQGRSWADAVVVYGGLGDPEEKSVWGMLSSIAVATGAQGVFVFDALGEGRARTATEGLIAYLSHDLPIDTALAKLAAEHQVSVLSWATRSLAETTSVRVQGQLLARRLKQMPDALIQRGGDVASGVTAIALGETLEESLRRPEQDAAGGDAKELAPPLSFGRESEGARTVAMLADETAPVSDADAARREARYLQARVETPARRPVKEKARLLAGHDYVATVFIGARAPAWLGLDKPFEAPEPPDGRPLLLNVLFWEPQASPKPQIKQLKLPPRGNSGVASFPFRTADGQSSFSARVAVYHRNRNLQTGLLRGQVGEGPAGLRFIPDAAPLPKFVGLEDRAGVGASIILNDDPSGDIKAYVFRDGVAGVGSVSDGPPPLASGEPPLSVNVSPSGEKALENLTAALGRAITRITDAPDEYDDLAKGGSRKLLLDLAQHGSALLRRLQKHTLMRHQFDGVGYVQIVTAHPDAFFPVEYLYGGIL